MPCFMQSALIILLRVIKMMYAGLGSCRSQYATSMHNLNSKSCSNWVSEAISRPAIIQAVQRKELMHGRACKSRTFFCTTAFNKGGCILVVQQSTSFVVLALRQESLEFDSSSGPLCVVGVCASFFTTARVLAAQRQQSVLDYLQIRGVCLDVFMSACMDVGVCMWTLNGVQSVNIHPTHTGQPRPHRAVGPSH